MKTLYFDIDGTVLMAEQAATKPRLAGGELESAIRMAGFQKLVCVGNFCNIAAVMKDMGLEYDELGVLLDICGGAFTDALWFRSMTTLVPEPQHRARHIDFSGDWWYLDDLAADYLRAANYEDILTANLGARVFIPNPTGDGQDIVDWLHGLAV